MNVVIWFSFSSVYSVKLEFTEELQTM